MVTATTLGANHLMARVAFEHGTNVTTAVAVRSTGTALCLLLLLIAQGISLKVSRPTLAKTTLIGLLMTVQSYCLYSSVALIPVALALLAFNLYPMIFVLISWIAGGERLGRRALVAMPVALGGLSLALDVWGRASSMAGRWAEIGAGVLWALGAALSFGMVLFLNNRWLKEMDGRLRTFLSMCVVAAVIVVYGFAASDLRPAADATGWAALVLLTVFYGAGITALFVLLPRLEAVNNTVALNFEPIAVLALAWVILDQRVAPLQIVGAFVVVGAIAWLGLKR